MHKSYTYLIGWSKHNKWYYGYRSKNKLSPKSDLWNIYFTSSKHVKKFREEYGEPDVIEIRKTFDCKEKCRLWEEKVLKRMQVDVTEKWLNKKIYGNQFVCIKHSEEIKQKISKSLLERDYTDSKETRHKKSITKLGNRNPNKNGNARKGVILSLETKQKISKKLLGFNYGTWWNNGEISKRSINIPGENFKPGRILWR